MIFKVKILYNTLVPVIGNYYFALNFLLNVCRFFAMCKTLVFLSAGYTLNPLLFLCCFTHSF